MHEIGMCEGVLAAAKQRAGGRPVAALGVRVGVGLRVVPDAFAQAFELVAAGTVAEGARVDLVTVAAQGRCLDCGSTFDADQALPSCPSCGGASVHVAGGDELTLEWLRYREPDAAASGERSAATRPGG